MMTDDAFVRLFQDRTGLKVDGWPGKDTIAKLDQLAPSTSPLAIAIDDVPDGYWSMLERIESSNRPYAKAGTSSASGAYQFTKATWEGEGGAWGTDPSEAFGGLRPSMDEQTDRIKTFTAKNVNYLKAQGIGINKASLYAAHFLGRTTAGRVLAALPSADAAQLAGDAAARANPSVFYVDKQDASVREFKTWLHGKTGDWA